METIKQIKEEFLVCPACLQKYRNPKLLPCLHTFCRPCLSEYIVKSVEKEHENNVDGETEGEYIDKRFFKCPVCRTETYPAKSGIVVQDWADSFSDNHFIVSLMEKIDMHAVEKTCESCNREMAEKWCQNCKIAFCDVCIKAHDVIKACSEHVIMSLTDMRLDPLKSIKNTTKEIPCMEHREKIIEFYCVDCHVAICSSCVAVQHRRCEMVETVTDAARKLKPETEQLLADLNEQSEILRDWEKDHTNEIRDLASNKEGIVKEVSQIRKRINDILLDLEMKLLKDLEVKHQKTVDGVLDRLHDVEAMEKNLGNTNRFLKSLVQYGSDSELLAVFDKVKCQVEEMKETIHKAKLASLSTRYKLALDPTVSRVMEVPSLGKILDLIDLKKENFLKSNGTSGLGPQRKSSVRRSGTFRVDRPPDEPQPNALTTQPNTLTTQPNTLTTPSTSNDSVNSQDIPKTTTAPTSRSSLRTAFNRQSASRASPRTPRAPSAGRVQRTKSSTDIQTKTMTATDEIDIDTKPPTVKKPTPIKQPLVTPRKLSVRSRAKQNLSERAPPQNGTAKNSSLSPVGSVSSIGSISKSDSLTMLCSFNGKREGDTKKCWPLDIAVLGDGTPVITDFHNKKIKAFDASGSVSGEVMVPSWPHGITDVSKSELAVTLPELSTIVFILVQEGTMRIRKKLRTIRQYRGIACDTHGNENSPSLVVSCCIPNNQSIDIVSMDGNVLETFRRDIHQPGHALFTWPYYVCLNPNGEILVSDCETRNGVVCLTRNGDVKQDYIQQEDILREPRGICTDKCGNVFLADKTANTIHSFGSDGKYRRPILSSRDGLLKPIAVCISPYGQLMVTQDNGDVKVFLYAMDV